MTISIGNQMQAFKDENGNIVQVNELQLLLDVKHRWDSLFLMLHRLKELKPV
jgi:phage anti-repressor protein